MRYDLGSVSTEHALLVMFIAIVVAAVLAAFGQAVLGLFDTSEIDWDPLS